MEEFVGRLRRELRLHRIPLQLRKGGEVAVDRLERLTQSEARRFGLAGNPGYLLVEFPYQGWPLRLPHWIFQLRTSGITPVLAHPERNAEVQASPDRLAALVEGGALVQATAASLDGRLGRAAEECGLELVDAGLVHLVASDAHSASTRAIGLHAAVSAIGDEALARWLTQGVPQAIVEGLPIPARPERRRRFFRR